MTVPPEVWPGLGWGCLDPEPDSCPVTHRAPLCVSTQPLSSLQPTRPRAEPGVVLMVVDSEGLRLSRSLGAWWEADPHLLARTRQPGLSHC